MTGGQDQSDQVAGQLAGLCIRSGRGDRVSAEAVELADVGEVNGQGVGVFQQVGVEASGQRREPLVELPEGDLVLVAEPRAGECVARQVAIDQVARFGVEPLIAAGDSLRYGSDPRVEVGVEADAVAMRREAGCDPLLELGDERGLVGRAQREEHRGDALQDATASLECLDRVGEAWRLGVADDRSHLGDLLGHAPFERGLVVIVADLGEWGQLERQRARGEERVLGHDLSLLRRNAVSGLPSRGSKGYRQFQRRNRKEIVMAFEPKTISVGVSVA